MKNDADSMADFRDGFDFDEAFDEGFQRDGFPLLTDFE